MVLYQLRDGFHSRLPAHVIGGRIDELMRRNATPENPEGHTTNDEILEDARPTGSPLHGHFTWDESEAARKWNLEEASYLKRSYFRVIVQEQGEPIVINPPNVVIRHPNPEDPNETPIIVKTDTAAGREAWRIQMLQDTIRQLEGMQARLRGLEGITPAILKALDIARKLIEKAAQKKPKSAKAKVKV